MFGISVDFIVGLTVGLEHDSGDEDDSYFWAIALHLGLVRVVLVKLKPE